MDFLLIAAIDCGGAGRWPHEDKEDNADVVTVIGGANTDIKGKPSGTFLPRTSNPGTITETAGGVGRNVAHNLALLGIPTALITAVGDDVGGNHIRTETAAAGVDLSATLVVPGVRTGTYLAILDERGEMVAAVSDMHILEELTAFYLNSQERTIRRARLVVVDANLEEEALAYVLATARAAKVPVVALPVSVEKAVRLVPYLAGVDYLIANRHELTVLVRGPSDVAGIADKQSDGIVDEAAALLAAGPRAVLVTLGPAGVFVLARQAGGTPAGTRLAAYPGPVVDVTGAGDAFAAGFVYGLYHGSDTITAARYGLAAARLTVAATTTVSPQMSAAAIGRLVEGKPSAEEEPLSAGEP